MWPFIEAPEGKYFFATNCECITSKGNNLDKNSQSIGCYYAEFFENAKFEVLWHK